MRNVRYFQWIEGEHTGDVVTLVDISELDGEYFYNFSDGETCNSRFVSKVTNNKGDLLGKFVVEVNNPNNIWTFVEKEAKIFKDYNSGEESEIPTLHDILQSGNSSEATISDSDLGKKEIVPPKGRQNLIDLPDYEDYKTVEIAAPDVVAPVDVKPEKTEAPVVISFSNVDTEIIDNSKKPEPEPKQDAIFDPVRILVNTCKKNPTDIDLTITIKLPGKAIYQIADANFEDGGKKFIDFIVDDIDTEILVNSLKEALSSAYKDENNVDK